MKPVNEIRSQLQRFTDLPNGEGPLDVENDYLRDEIDKAIRLEQLKTIRQNNKERLKFGGLIFALTCLWLFLVLMIVIGKGKHFFELSDSVLITLITTTSINVLGYFVLVIKYLFNPAQST